MMGLRRIGLRRTGVRPTLGGWLMLAALAGACGGADATNEAQEGAPSNGLAVVHAPDPALVETGRRAFADGELIQGVIPPEALRHLYITWSDDLAALYTYYSDPAAYWKAFDERYGTIPSPFEGATYPAGFGVADDGQIGIDCLLCHAGRLEGKTIIGLGNNRLDLRGLVEDLKRLPEAIAALKMQPLPAPYDRLVQVIPDTEVPEPYASLEVPTAAAGANDGFGLGLVTSAQYGDPPRDLKTFMGYEDPPPWWTIRHKERLYTDGSAPAEGIYTMMSTLLAFGLSFSELAAYVPTFEAIRHYLCSLEAPRWEDHALPPVDPELAAIGASLFVRDCARCHGAHDGGAFLNLVVAPGEVGTDALRAASFGPTEAEWLNGFIPDPEGEMISTGGYLAPALVGIWASAPYLHNGSIPTLRALLDANSRPTRWRRSGEAVDPVDVGLSYEAVDAPTDRDTIEGRKVVDTSVEGMSNGGHDFPLMPDEIDALLAFMKTL
jgi:hypothetical protein